MRMLTPAKLGDILANEDRVHDAQHGHWHSLQVICDEINTFCSGSEALVHRAAASPRHVLETWEHEHGGEGGGA